MAPWLSLLLLFLFFCTNVRALFNDRADVQEQFIGSFVTVSVKRAGVSGFFVANLISCSCVVCVCELEVR